MKTTKLVANIFSLVFFLFIIFQSCAAGLSNAFSGNSEDTSGAAGIFLAIFMLIAAIVGLANRKNEKGDIATAILYGLAAIIGFSSLGTFTDLVVWASLSLIFAVLYVISFTLALRKSKKEKLVESVETE